MKVKEYDAANVQFVPVTESEVRNLGELRQQAWAATYRGIYPDEMIDHFDYKWHEEKDLLRIRSPQFCNWFIQLDGEKVGYLTLRNADYLFLYSLYLLPKAQKKGIGRQALTFVAQYCEQRQIMAFRCHCQPDNTNAVGFYEKMGGIIVDRDEENTERWQNTVVFEFQTTNFL